MRKFEPVVVTPAREKGKIAPTQIAHCVLMTRSENFEPMVDWYLTVLEAEISYANDNIAFLAYDEEHHRLAIGVLPIDGVQKPPNAWGVDHIAFTYANLEDLVKTYKRLKAAGIEPYWCINHGPTMSMYYKDPDGNRAELFSDNFTTAEQMQEYFASGSFEENFMGIIYDPDELVAKFEAGVPYEELIKRPKLPVGKSPWDMHIP